MENWYFRNKEHERFGTLTLVQDADQRYRTGEVPPIQAGLYLYLARKESREAEKAE